MPSSIVLRVATRASRLARCQTAAALAGLATMVPAVVAEMVLIETPGDRDRQLDLRLAPPDFFTRDLDDALRNGQVDAALHSAKDLPEPMPADLDWAWLPWRAEPRDALVLAPGRSLAELPARPRIGVSSDRRAAWLAARLPGAEAAAIRGDIETRLVQVDEGRFDGVVMAGAALERLGLLARVSEWIPLDELPVPDGQGVLALTFRVGDRRLQALRALFTPALRFVGAGVGDRRWLSEAGREALRHADRCFHDALIDPRLLDLLPVGARAVAVGKRCGMHAVDQATICCALVDAARRGEQVVRLKGGDPGLFGRLAEELAACSELGLPYEVQPGISSLQVASATSGKLLTTRESARGFCVLTPRAAGGGRAAINAAARTALPLAVFMGRHLLADLAAELLADGLDPDTPAAVIDGAGGNDEQVTTTTLAALPAVPPSRSGQAGLVLIGGSAGDRPRPGGALAGLRVLITASSTMQAEAARLVRDHGGRPLALPLIRLEATAQARAEAHRLSACDWLVLSSPSTVHLIADLAREAGLGLQHLPFLIACGPGTARELTAVGLIPDLVPIGDYGGDGLFKAIRSGVPVGASLLVPRSDRAVSDWPERLRAEGYTVETPMWFANRSVAHDHLPAHDAAIFLSPSAVAVFVEAWGAMAFPHRCIAIGRPTAAALRAQGVAQTIVAAEATLASCITTLAGHVVAECLQEES